MDAVNLFGEYKNNNFTTLINYINEIIYLSLKRSYESRILYFSKISWISCVFGLDVIALQLIKSTKQRDYALETVYQERHKKLMIS